MRTLVAMVERWSQMGDPTAKARLAQVRALLDLCMMDRAWTRLQAMRHEERNDCERLELTARMFLARGWPKRARKVLDEATDRFPEHEVWAELSQLAEAPPRRAPAIEPRADDAFEHRVAASEAYLATGAYLKARRLLESLDRDHPDDPRVQDLLWALRGDYELAGHTLQSLVERYSPSSAFADLGDFDEDADLTESITVADVPFASTWDGGQGAFPTMFLDGDDDEEGTARAEPAEVTQSTSVDELDRAIAPPVSFGDDDDTQVLRVVSMAAELKANDFDFSPPTSPGLVDELEGEDDAVVMLTRQQERQPPHQVREMLPIENIPEPEIPAPPPPPVVTTPLPPPPPPAPSTFSAKQMWMLALVVVLLAGAGLMLMLFALFQLS